MGAKPSSPNFTTRRLRHSQTLLGQALLVLLLLFALATSACLKATKPTLPKVFPAPQQLAPKNKPPLIIIPGILGTELVNQKTQQRLWPELFPADRDALLLPIASANLRENRDDIAATRVIEQADLGKLVPQIGVYAGLLQALENYAGYKRGDIDNPANDGGRDTFYLFAYDWRRDNVEAAQLLAEKLAKLKAKLNQPELRFDVIAHSMGGLIARYYAMYGGRDVLSDPMSEPDWAGLQHINRLILIGTPNAGSFDAFRSLLQGYSVTEANHTRVALFRGLHQRMIFTVPSVYQLLPRNTGARFFNEKLERLPLDLYDAEIWRQQHWSAAFDPVIQTRERKDFAKKRGLAAGELAAKELAERRALFMAAALARARAFQHALDAHNTNSVNLPLYLIGGDCEPTIAGAFLIQENGVPITLFWPNKALGNRQQRRRAIDLIFLPGDGRVTRQSLLGLTLEPEASEPFLRAMKATPQQTLFNCDVHGDLPLNLIIQNNLLTLLLGNQY
ncbi:MAG: alpha/beta fold hydrolase [Acidobacteria bacterium]|nr:alpha/beta fold hydrolase [Acidobacteriota bacterium]MBI3427808.1 alpha/beta fold hydrolase [Acidobacteriota bacterium]